MKLLLAILTIIPAVWATDTLRLDVDRAVELALANNYLVQQAQEKVMEAAAGKATAFGSFLPQVTATGSYVRLAKVNTFNLIVPVETVMGVPVLDPRGIPIGTTVPIPVTVGAETLGLKLGSENNYSLRGTVQQTLFTWGKLINAYRIAGLSLDVQKEALRQARGQVRIQATEGFYQALLAERMVVLLEESYNQLRRHVDQVQALYDNGLATRLDLMRARVSLTNLEAQRAQLANARQLALAALCNTIGIPQNTPIKLEEELKPETLAIDLASATDSALRSRPELLQLRRAIQIANLGVNIAKTANLPSLFAAANYDYKRPVGFQDEWGTDYNATIGLSMPIFTGLGNLQKLRQAQSRERQARIALAMAEEGVKLEVLAQVLALEQEQKNIAYQAQSVELAQEALNLAEQRYQHGLLSNLEYLDTQLTLTQSKVAYLNALANYQIAKARLLRAIGAF
ncbi:MAG: TolC family protein [candidate division WOR-3 bacterium]